jgi:hypothetical protein
MVSDNPESFADLDGHQNQTQSNAAPGPCTDSSTAGCSAQIAAQKAAAQQAAINQKKCGFWCGLGQRIKNGFTGNGFNTNEQLKGTVTVSATYSLRKPNPSVTAATDALGLVGTVVKAPEVVGRMGAAASMANDPSGSNITFQLIGLLKPFADSMALNGAFVDAFGYGTENNTGTPTDTWKGAPIFDSGDNAGGAPPPVGISGSGGGGASGGVPNRRRLLIYSGPC